MGRDDLVLPPSLGWLGQTPEGHAWLGSVPQLVAECAERWGLRIGRPYPDSFVALVLAVTPPDGEPAVLKIQFPGRESEHEAAALVAWGGVAAVRLLDHDPARRALLIERCEPGTHLSALHPNEALEVLSGLLPRLWVPAPAPIRPLADEAAWWAAGLVGHWERAGRPFESALVDGAIDAMHRLAGTQGEAVLLHQDLHADNVLASRRDRWLAIDPKPLVGEREFALAPIVRSYELGHSRTAVVHRLDRLSDALDLDRERARGWVLAQTVAWAFEGDRALPQHVETARWLLQA